LTAGTAQSLFPSSTPPAEGGEKILLNGRFVIREQISRRVNVSCYLAADETCDPPRIVQLVRGPREVNRGEGIWHRLDWEEELRQKIQHPSMPRIIERVTSDGADYLVLEMPHGPNLWDAWDDPGVNPGDKFNWLIQIAELLSELHAAGAILDGLRPDQIIVTQDGRAMLADGSGLLPLPMPLGTPVVPTRTTAPELLTGVCIDARADLYGFGALVYSLVLERELSDGDFVGEGRPVAFLERFPDAHPLVGRLLAKTFCPDRVRRFPTYDGSLIDPTGFHELIGILEQCQEALSRARLDVASWTSTGMVRHGNEDTFAVLHSCAGMGDQLGDTALVLVSDGMGGSAAGEVAASIAIHELHRSLSGLVNAPTALAEEHEQIATGLDQESTARDRMRSEIISALKQANRSVHRAAVEGPGQRGMGCTAEVVYTDGRRLIIGHVGDSRTYRFRRGRLALLTRDHTYVGRLVEFGEITPEEAETHPRRAELQQALGGWAEVEPDMIDVPLEAGDWVLVCSDGLSGIVKPLMIQNVLERASSADDAARRLVNLANHLGAPDNVTLAVIRAI
jgi:serine/threonine protein phosphatase PrpC